MLAYQNIISWEKMKIPIMVNATFLLFWVCPLFVVAHLIFLLFQLWSVTQFCSCKCIYFANIMQNTRKWYIKLTKRYNLYFREWLHCGILYCFFATALRLDMGELSVACILVLQPWESSLFLIRKLKADGTKFLWNFHTSPTGLMNHVLNSALRHPFQCRTCRLEIFFQDASPVSVLFLECCSMLEMPPSDCRWLTWVVGI